MLARAQTRRLLARLAAAACVVLPVAAAAADRGVQFVGDFETGDVSQWESLEGARSPDSLRVLPGIGSAGRYGADIRVHPTDQAYGGDVRSGRTRVELTRRSYGPGSNPADWFERSRCNPGQTSWYRAQFLLPLDLNPNPTSFNILMQWHAANGALAPPLALRLKVLGRRDLQLELKVVGGRSSAPHRVTWPLELLPRTLGVWRDVIVGVHWATDASGWVEAWRRDGLSGPFERVVDGSVRAPRGGGGVPTLYSDVSPVGCYLKVGFYRGPERVDGVPRAFHLTSHVIEDGFAIGGSLDAVAALAPAGGH
jgi:hypothetical protein